ncbi:MAG: hypothetical protein SNJ75_03140 [Gemmataceae bacterium]
MRGGLLFFLLPLLANAAETPQELLARAIVAHGGASRLLAARAEQVQMRGVHYVGGAEVPFTNTMTLQLPERFKSVLSMGNARVINLFDGEQAALLINGKPQKMTAAQLGQLRQTLALNQVMRLVPLLRDKGVSLTPLGEYTIQGTTVVGVAVKRAGWSEVKLFFDKQTALLRASEQVLEAPGIAAVVQQARYSDHRDVGGYVRPGKITVFRDGKKVMEAVLTEARRLDTIDPAEFRIPKTGP